MHAREFGAERPEQQPLDRAEVRVSTLRRHAALVAEEQVHERPVDVLPDHGRQETLGDGAPGHRQREAAARGLRAARGGGGVECPALGEPGDRGDDDGGLVSHGHRWPLEPGPRARVTRLRSTTCEHNAVASGAGYSHEEDPRWNWAWWAWAGW